MGIKQFPAIYIKTKYQDKFQTVLGYEGFLDVPKVFSLIQSVLLACEAEIAQSAEISAVRALQSEQDSAYLRSLEIDREKLRLKLIGRAQSVSADAVKEASEFETNKHKPEESGESERMKSKDSENTKPFECSTFPSQGFNSPPPACKLNERISRAFLDVEDEPSKDSTGSFKFQFLFPDGTRKIRCFHSESTTKV